MFIGSINFGLFLTTYQRVPEGMQRVIENADSSMVESGLLTFYRRFSSFLTKFRSKQLFGDEFDGNEVEMKGLAIEQLKIPLIIYLILIGVASIVFFTELVVYKMKKVTKVSIVAEEMFLPSSDSQDSSKAHYPPTYIGKVKKFKGAYFENLWGKSHHKTSSLKVNSMNFSP